MSTRPAGNKRQPADVARESYQRALGGRPEWSCRAPGRVNLIGGHVDYSDGLVLPAAVELEVGLAFAPRDDRRVRIYSADFDETVEFDIDELTPGSEQGWPAYPAGVAWVFAQHGLSPRGLDAAVAGNIPIGGGLSSSAALEIAFAAAFRQVSEIDLPNLQMARLAQAAENHYVGVNCGIMDQVASACAEPGSAILLDCRSLDYRRVPIPAALRIVVIDSGVKRELRTSEYNRRRSECEEAVSRLSAFDDEIRALRDVTPEQLHTLIRHLPAPLDRRARHVVGEIERVRLAAAALEHGETERFGELMFASHRSSRDDYQVSIEELDALVELAARAPGVVGARLTGAGFGGCTVNVVSAALVDDFIEYVGNGYANLFSDKPTAFVSDPARGVSLNQIW